MATIDPHNAETSRDDIRANPAAEGLGEIFVRRDALQASARAEAFLMMVRAVRRGIAARRAARRHH